MSQTWQEKTGATPGKLLLIGLLFVAFLGVVVYQFTNSANSISVETPEVVAEAEANPLSGPANASRSTNLCGETGHVPPLRSTVTHEASFEEIVAHDPFRRPHWGRAADPKADQEESAALTNPNEPPIETAQTPEETFNDLKREGVRAIVVAGGERIALIGTRQIRVGDQVEGLRVLEINRDGVVLAPPTIVQ